MDSKDIVKIVIRALEDKKGEELQVIDISSISTLGDYFIIGQGSNRSQIQAMADNVEELLAKEKVYPKQIEGYQTANWILMDYRDVIVHIFDPENRGYYDLERIWNDGKLIDLNEFKD